MKLLKPILSGLMLLAATQTVFAKNLIVYFSMPLKVTSETVDGYSGASAILKDGRELGATEYLARQILQQAGGDLFRIEVSQDYPKVYRPLTEFAQAEQRRDYRPPLKAKIPNLNDYDTIFLGYPNWWGQFPMPLHSFFDNHDLNGKTVIPFVAHGGSRFSDTVNEIKRLYPKADVKNGFDAYLFRSRHADADIEKNLSRWLDGLGFKQ